MIAYIVILIEINVERGLMIWKISCIVSSTRDFTTGTRKQTPPNLNLIFKER